jgi:hypothetical protein
LFLVPIFLMPKTFAASAHKPKETTSGVMVGIMLISLTSYYCETCGCSKLQVDSNAVNVCAIDHKSTGVVSRSTLIITPI